MIKSNLRVCPDILNNHCPVYSMRVISPALALALLVVVTTNAGAAYGQDLTVSCSANLQARQALTVEFGLSPAAAVGVDPLDEPLPPAAPGQDFQVYLQMPTPSSPLPNRWRKEIRPFDFQTATRIEIWSMTVECVSAGGILTLATELVPGTAPPYALAIIDPEGAEYSIASGSSLDFPCTSDVMVFYWILQYDEQVRSRSATWGGTKTTFRD